MTVTIQPYSFLNHTVESIMIHLVNYQLNDTQVQIHYQLFDSFENMLYEDNVLLTNISAWGTNDSYIVNLVLQELNLTAA
jgi:hypothetical protein